MSNKLGMVITATVLGIDYMLNEKKVVFFCHRKI